MLGSNTKKKRNIFNKNAIDQRDFFGMKGMRHCELILFPDNFIPFPYLLPIYLLLFPINSSFPQAGFRIQSDGPDPDPDTSVL